jgi:hypothetical protein
VVIEAASRLISLFLFLRSCLGSSLDPKFVSWVKLAFLHLWLVEVRFRLVESSRERDAMTQPLYDLLWAEIENGLADTLVRG